MKKVLLFSFFLVLGLVVSQMLPAMVGEQYSLVKTISNTFLFICLAFIMINVGREFEIDKTRWKSYTEDYFIAMATAAFPWIFVALYYMFVLLPGDLWGSWDAWKENLLLSRFAAPTSAGILFTMLAAAGRSKALRRGSTASTKPSPPPSSRTWTQSPTRGDSPSRRNLPRARHCRVSAPVFT